MPIGKIRYVDEEHTIEPSLMGKGVRMDVFVDDGTGTVYDVEMQNVDEKNLALRSRYLLSSFDRDRIERGEDYIELGKSIVIFVCVFDPLGKGERVYAVRPMEERFHEPFMMARCASSSMPKGQLKGSKPLPRCRERRCSQLADWGRSLPMLMVVVPWEMNG